MRKYKIMMMDRGWVSDAWSYYGDVTVKDGQYPYLRAQMAFPGLRHGHQWKLVRV